MVHSYRTQKHGTRFLYNFGYHGRMYRKSGFRSYDECLNAEKILMADLIRESCGLVTWQELLSSFEDRYIHMCKVTTYLMFLERRRKYLDTFPDGPVSIIDYAKLSGWFDSLGCSISTKKKLLVDLKHLFDYCSYMFHVDNTEYRKLFLPKDYSIHLPKRRYVLSLADFRKMLAFEEDNGWRLFFIVTFVCGLRIGEVRGIQVKNVDPKDSSIVICQQVSNKLGTGRTELISPKSEKSNRYCYIPASLMVRLMDRIHSLSLASDDFLFPSKKRNDYPIGSSDVYREFHRIRDLAGFPCSMKFHVFRKSEASLLNDIGISGEIIRDYLGHDSFETTKHYYIGDSEDKKREISRILDSRFSDLFDPKKDG